MRRIRQFFRAEHGTTSVEYAVMLASILLVLIAGVSLFGNAQSGSWFHIDSELQAHGIN
ncbi:Flp family type IVb pilin [bacterium]|nr:Flp family type IVb pilin [bacterium]